MSLQEFNCCPGPPADSRAMDSLRLKPSATWVFLVSCKLQHEKVERQWVFRRGRSIYRHWKACLSLFLSVFFPFCLSLFLSFCLSFSVCLFVCLSFCMDGVVCSWGIPIAPHFGIIGIPLQCWRAIDYSNKSNLRVKCYLFRVTMPNCSLLKVTMK